MAALVRQALTPHPTSIIRHLDFTFLLTQLQPRFNSHALALCSRAIIRQLQLEIESLIYARLPRMARSLTQKNRRRQEALLPPLSEQPRSLSSKAFKRSQSNRSNESSVGTSSLARAGKGGLSQSSDDTSGRLCPRYFWSFHVERYHLRNLKFGCKSIFRDFVKSEVSNLLELSSQHPSSDGVCGISQLGSFCAHNTCLASRKEQNNL